jgi:hypothetical protein
MDKIAVDAYRYYEYNKLQFSNKHQKHRKQLDERPIKESMTRTKRGMKNLGENLNPLKRWLRKQVGRRWDDVYSEIVTTLRGGYTSLEHIKTHIFDNVKRGKIQMRDGWPYACMKYTSLYEDPWYALTKEDLYVDLYGFLRTPPLKKLSPAEKRRNENKKRHNIIMLDAVTAASKIGGVWFAADLKEIPEYESYVIDHTRCNPYKNPDKIVKIKVVVKRQVTDVLIKRSMQDLFQDKNLVEKDAHYRRRINIPYDTRKLYAPNIRTMSKKEIKRRIPEELR